MKKKNGIKKTDVFFPKSYAQFLEHVKKDILQTQLRTAQSVTTELTFLPKPGSDLADSASN